MPTKELFGRYLDQFEAGEVIDHWPARTVTEADDLMFCMLTMNHHPLHTNREYAEDTAVRAADRVGARSSIRWSSA